MKMINQFGEMPNLNASTFLNSFILSRFNVQMHNISGRNLGVLINKSAGIFNSQLKINTDQLTSP